MTLRRAGGVPATRLLNAADTSRLLFGVASRQECESSLLASTASPFAVRATLASRWAPVVEAEGRASRGRGRANPGIGRGDRVRGGGRRNRGRDGQDVGSRQSRRPRLTPAPAEVSVVATESVAAAVTIVVAAAEVAAALTNALAAIAA